MNLSPFFEKLFGATSTPADRSAFPAGTRFVIKEFDVPLTQIPQDGKSIWTNWFGGKPRPYDPAGLRVDNNWTAQSFEEWIQVVRNSMK